MVPSGYRVGEWEVTEPIGAGGWGTVYAARYVGGQGEAGEDGGAPGPRPGPRPGAGAEPGPEAEPGAGTGPGPEAEPGAGPGGAAEVALKFLPTAGLAPRQARGLMETARREIELGRRAQHPRLIRLLDSLTLSEPENPVLDGAVVLVMERARHSLRERLHTPSADGSAAPSPSGAGSSGPPAQPPLSAAEGARLLTEICEGLAHLHSLGWVHGDLKPDNVLIVADGSVRLSDFGLAVELNGTHGYIPPLGTPDYLPPERWRAPLGERGVQVRPSTDIWALGIMIHQVFTGGASPFAGATPMARGAAAQEYAEGRASLRMDLRVPPFWRELAADCLIPSPDERAAHTASSLLARIRAEQEQGRQQGRERDVAPLRAGRRGRAALLAAAVATVAGGAAAVGWAFLGGEDRTPRTGGPSEGPGRTVAGERTARVEVFNAEEPCRQGGNRDPMCSLGLAIDPMEPYTLDNVVATRVWHGDTMVADCQVPQGVPIADEAGARSTQWFRVRLPAGEGRSTAWLPAVRAKDRPALPECPGRPSAS
ncbi:serine/threonine-protein kinase [Streptomyces gobitricini]